VSDPPGRDGPAGVPRRSPTGPLLDAVVVGLGALGSAAAWVLARSGARVLGLEQFELGHHRGASHDHARLPAATAAHDHTATCLYTLTPDRDLVLGPVGGHDRVLVALGAAHGFKFAPLVGRVLADLALHGGTDVDITPFALDRPALTTAPSQANYLV
jgi:glycine/D-amino acid oxidase-like deaminating enzyme